ncbi:MAG: HD domain-containing protein [Gemmatimonadales bacterium]|nr:HD domain-containing protein [Gemmatimonadales bacterium]
MSSSGLNAQVLTVERDPTRRAALRQALVEGGYEVLEAESCDGALHVLARRKIACVVATGDPADGSAAERVGRILRSEPAMAIVVLASDADVAVAIAAMRAGAMEYLGPDVSPAEVTLAVDQAVDRRRALAQDQEVARSLGIEVGRLTAELRRERSRGDQVALAALESLVYVVEAKDLWLAGHSVRVAQMAASIAAELEHSDEEIEQIRIAGRLHDIGMVSVSEFILSKEGPLSPEEFDKVRAHVTLGSQILSPLPGLAAVTSFVRHHHERWDGQGYPDRLSGEAAPWGARVIGVAEIYDALTTARPYQEPTAPDLAVKHMQGVVGSAIGTLEWRALAAVVGRKEALVFLVDEQTQAAPGARASALHL